MNKLSIITALALVALAPLSSRAQQRDAVSYSHSFSQGVEEYDRAHFEEALDAFLRAVQANPKDAEAVFNAGLAYQKLERPLEASIAFRRALELRPDYRKARARLCSALVDADRFLEGVQACGNAIRLERGDAQLYFEYGRAFAGAGLYAQAADAFKIAIRMRPADPETHFRLGLALRSLGEYRDALDALERAARLGPSDRVARAYAETIDEVDALDRELGSVKGPDRLLNLGHAYRLKGEYARAAAVYRYAARLGPKDSSALFYEGLAYYSMGQYYRALASYKKALAVDPGNKMARSSFDWLSGFMKGRETLEATSPLESHKPEDGPARQRAETETGKSKNDRDRRRER